MKSPLIWTAKIRRRMEAIKAKKCVCGNHYVPKNTRQKYCERCDEPIVTQAMRLAS